MKIIFEGTGSNSERFIYAMFIDKDMICIRIEDLKRPSTGKEITMDKSELQAFVQRLNDLIEQF